MKNSPKNLNLLEAPTLIQKGIFSSEEAELLLKYPRRKLHAVLFRLVQKGKLIRIKKGLFVMRPPGTEGLLKGYPCNWFLVARSLCEGAPYFVSHYSAMHLHGMTSEAIRTVFLSRPDQKRVPKGLRIPLQFVTVSRKNFWGFEEKWVTNEEKVFVSDLERTVLDILDRPDLAGGILEIARGIWLVREKLNFNKLIYDLKRFGSQAVAKRLGYLMSLMEIGTEDDLKEIHSVFEDSGAFAFLDPTVKKGGQYLSVWRLVINIDPDEIKGNLVT